MLTFRLGRWIYGQVVVGSVYWPTEEEQRNAAVYAANVRARMMREEGRSLA